jgi:hypothetical protein
MASSAHTARARRAEQEGPAGIFGSLGTFLACIGKEAEVWVCDLWRDVPFVFTPLRQHCVHLTCRVQHLPGYPVYCCSVLAAESSAGPRATRLCFPTRGAVVPLGAPERLQLDLHRALVDYLRSPACQPFVAGVVEGAVWETSPGVPWSLLLRGGEEEVTYREGVWAVRASLPADDPLP